jgi:hypothetical protein
VSSEVRIDRRVADAMKGSLHHISFADVYGSVLPSGVLRCITATGLGADNLPDGSIRSNGSDEQKIRGTPLS